jgi:hypothetical protein
MNLYNPYVELMSNRKKKPEQEGIFDSTKGFRSHGKWKASGIPGHGSTLALRWPLLTLLVVPFERPAGKVKGWPTWCKFVRRDPAQLSLSSGRLVVVAQGHTNASLPCIYIYIYIKVF